MALSAIGEIGDARAIQRLERALRESRPEVRYQAVIAYARVAKDDAPAVATALVRALDDEDSAIRYIAMRVAEEQRAPSATRRQARGARARSSSEGPDAAVAVVAALYLARLGRAPGPQVVLDVVAERREAPELEDEQACVEAAGELEMRDAVPFLEQARLGAPPRPAHHLLLRRRRPGELRLARVASRWRAWGTSARARTSCATSAPGGARRARPPSSLPVARG